MLRNLVINVFKFLHLVSESDNLLLRRQHFRLHVDSVRHKRLLICADCLLLHLAISGLEELHDLFTRSVVDFRVSMRVLHLIVISCFGTANLFYLRRTKLCCKQFIKASYWVLFRNFQHSFAKLLPKKLIALFPDRWVI